MTGKFYDPVKVKKREEKRKTRNERKGKKAIPCHGAFKKLPHIIYCYGIGKVENIYINKNNNKNNANIKKLNHTPT